MIDEVCVYAGPGTTRHDDFVDSFSQGVRYFADRWLDAGVMAEIRPDGADDSKLDWEDERHTVGQADAEGFIRWEQNPYDA